MSVLPCTENVTSRITRKKGGYQKHSYGKGKQIKAATYKTTGLMRYTCQVCGYEKTETIPVIAHTHKYTWKTTAKATVFRPAKQEGTCSLCGKKTDTELWKQIKGNYKTERILHYPEAETGHHKGEGFHGIRGFHKVLGFQQQKDRDR